jgi:pyruvate formate lyase activating enzyme
MSVQCGLCPKHCMIAEGESGECRIRVNIDGRLRAVTYGRPCSVHVDPIEKKPLFHMLPGSTILSIATVGCNLHCKNCQNWQISQCNPESSSSYRLAPEEIPSLASTQNCRSVAYTYTEPAVYYEYALDSARAVHEAGLMNVLVTAAYINLPPWRELCRHVDAANIDLKSMSERFYREVCSGTLRPVQDAIVAAKQAGVMVEITNLIIPTMNDSDEDLRSLARWIRENTGRDTPLHFSRFFPQYRMQNLPPTPAATLERARDIAADEGLHFVYVGNILSADGENTRCPHCGGLLIRRSRYTIIANHMRAGRCGYCGGEVYGLWN